MDDYTSSRSVGTRHSGCRTSSLSLACEHAVLPKAALFISHVIAALFFAAHRRFIWSDNFFLPAAVSLLPVRTGRPADCGSGLVCGCGLIWLRLPWPSARI